MNKATARSVLLVFGIWSVAGVMAWLLSLLIPVSGISFRGDVGIVLLWVWLGIPHLLAAIVAAYTLVWVTDTRRPLSWLLGLAALFLYSEGMRVWRQTRQPWHHPSSVPDHIGIAIATIIPAVACLVIGISWKKRLTKASVPC